MKIDIHTHTRKCKSGDAPTREVSPQEFCETILATEVRIVAVTNHNVFDLKQFEEIQSRMNGDAQVWPGIELDVSDGSSRGHLLVIVSPRSAPAFSAAVDKLTKNISPDTFAATVDDVLHSFEALNPLYVAHYKQKRPNLSDELLAILEAKAKSPECIIKEVTNSISAGIYISHGHSSIYGSDVHDWKKYEENSNDLPDLRLPVDSFEHFCLLLKKDPTTINTVLDRKTSEDLILQPFDDKSKLIFKAYNDINVIFGSKGTGKSCILKAISRFYLEKGIDARVYVSASDRLDDIFDTRGKDLEINLNNFGINYCTDEIKALRSAVEPDITSLKKFVVYFAAKKTNRNAKRILLKDIEPEKEGDIKREFSEFYEAAKTTSDFLEFLNKDPSVRKEFNEEEIKKVTLLLSDLLERLRKREWKSFLGWKVVKFLNSAINLFRKEVERKTGTPAKPTTTGFREYAINRIKIASYASEIIKNVCTQIPLQTDVVGNLGSKKGILQFVTEIVFQNGTLTDGGVSSYSGVKKGPQKRFVNGVRKIHKQVFFDDLFQHISELNEIEDVEDIKTVNELLMFKRYFSKDGLPYTPSSGESSMVMLHKELCVDKDVYILDEPERSLGHEYINDVIVPLIKERARAGKKVFISTHDANIAVRTLPYCSVYRCHGDSGYCTYIGNPFTNNLINPDDLGDRIDWKKTSMKTLEGGEEAFGERGKIYANT